MMYSSKISSHLANIPSPSSIHTVDESYMNIHCKGSIFSTNISLPDTFLIQSLHFNLISIGKLCYLGYYVIFSSHGCRVQTFKWDKTLGITVNLGVCFTNLYIPNHLRCLDYVMFLLMFLCHYGINIFVIVL